MNTRRERRTCIIIGAGVSGLVQAAELVRNNFLNHDDILILERANDYGGVWTAANYVSDNYFASTHNEHATTADGFPAWSCLRCV